MSRASKSLMILAAALVAACGPLSGGQVKPPPTAAASLAPSTLSSPLGIPLRAPKTFAAVTSDGRIALVSAATGQVAGYLTAAVLGGGPSELAPTADRKTIYFSRGDVVLPMAAAVCLGALPASLLGAHLSDRVQARSLKILMAVVLLAVGARMAVAGL